jgi:hypothetical protein
MHIGMLPCRNANDNAFACHHPVALAVCLSTRFARMDYPTDASSTKKDLRIASVTTTLTGENKPMTLIKSTL